MTKTLDVQLNEKGIDLKDSKAVMRFLLGKIVQVVGQNRNGHNYGSVGRTYKITPHAMYKISPSFGNYSLVNILKEPETGRCGNAIGLHNLTLGKTVPITVKDFESQVARYSGEDEESISNRKVHEEILNYMNENEVGEFNEDVYNVFRVLRDHKNYEFPIEKAEEIVKLLKQP